VLSPDRGTRRYSIAVGWGVGMDGSDGGESERAQMEVEARKLRRDFDARGGLVIIGPCPETDGWAGRFLYFLFQAGLTIAQHHMMMTWLELERIRLGSCRSSAAG
jgi:hypothetical protein